MYANPGYVDKLEDGSLRQKSEVLLAGLEDCTVCPHHCHVNRRMGELGFCRAGWEVEISGYGPHFGEEPPLIGQNGSGTIFFSHCNLGCVFCQNWDISQGEGDKRSFADLSDIMLELQEQGCHNINLVSPSHYVPQIVAAIAHAAERGLMLPIVYNCGGYDDLETLKYIDGIIDIYMPDFKFADHEVSTTIACVRDYLDIAKVALKEMHRQVGDLDIDEEGVAKRGLIIRHLVLPEKLAGTEKVMRFIAAEVSPYSYINIMDQYYPEFKAFNYHGINRRITAHEFRQAVKITKEASPHFRLAHET